MNEDSTMQIQNYNGRLSMLHAANYFHVLRRQQHRDFRKPLVVVAPKGLLRLRSASTFEDMAGALALSAIPERDPDSLVEDDKVRRIVFTSGAFTTTLLEPMGRLSIRSRQRVTLSAKVAAVVRMMSPFSPSRFHFSA